MDASEREEIPTLSAACFQPDDPSSFRSREFSSRRRSASMSVSTNYLDYSENKHNLVGSTSPLRNERWSSHVQMSGPSYVSCSREIISQPPQGALRQNTDEPGKERYASIDIPENKDGQSDDCVGKNERLPKSVCGDAKGWAERMCSFLQPYIPRVMDPQENAVHQWNKLFVISCMIAVFLDPLFSFLLSVLEVNKCMVLNWPWTATIAAVRSTTDFIYLLHTLLQFRLTYVDPKSGDVVDDPKRTAKNYLFGYFILDFFVALPLPQIIILLILRHLNLAKYAKYLLQTVVLVQYIPRLCRFLPLLAGFSSTGFIFESAWANFVINLLTFVLAGHVVGSCWYLLCLQRVDQCFREACNKSNIKKCTAFIDCGYGNDYRQFTNDSTWELWKNNENATACFGQGGFDFGIYETAVNLTTHKSIWTRYVYSLFWGFQQTSTLAGNQVPSYYVWEVLFTMAIIGVGLLLFALLIGNMQNFLQVLGRRNLEMLLRRHDVKKWMRYHHLPEDLRSQVKASERWNCRVTGGFNEEMLMENFQEDLQRKIRLHLFKFIQKVRIFQRLDLGEPIIDAIYERLRTETYIEGSTILFPGGLVDKMVFIIQGEMQSVGNNGMVVYLSEGDVCGGELLTWCLEHFSVNKDEKRIRIPGTRLLSEKLVTCSKNVKAIVLRSADLEEVTNLFARF